MAAACAAFLAVPGGASASSVLCTGNSYVSKNAGAGPNGVTYTVKCNEDIQAYSIISTKKLDYWQPDPLVLRASGQPDDVDAFKCEGPIPGPGFGCPGKMAAGHHVKGLFATDPPPCNPGTRIWVTVTTQQLDSGGNPFETSSEPFKLNGPCMQTPAAHRVAAPSQSASTGSITDLITTLITGPITALTGGTSRA